jgi:hypothetical protein
MAFQINSGLALLHFWAAATTCSRANHFPLNMRPDYPHKFFPDERAGMSFWLCLATPSAESPGHQID